MSVISAILHRFQSAIADAGEAGLLGPDEWNDTHDVTVDVPAASAFSDAQAEGVATSLSRSDHVHAREADPVTAHEAAGDPHAGYRLETADHSHASTGLQGGQLAQANTHGTPDTDAAAGSLHHTIGAGANQAAAGNHIHAYKYNVIRLFAFAAPATFNINNTSYAFVGAAFEFNVDLDIFPFTHYRLFFNGLSNAVGQTVTCQLATFGGLATPIHTGGNDVALIPNTAGIYDSGWLTRDDAATGTKAYLVAWKGSNSTVDVSANYMEVHLRKDD